MNTLPIELENIIIDYKNQMEHKEKFQSTLEAINNIEYFIFKQYNVSSRALPGAGYMNDNNVEYYNITTQDLHIEHHFVFRGDETIYTAVVHANIKGIYFEDLGVSYD